MRIVTPDTQCAPLALAQNSPLYGTATEVQTWFLLEYNGPWTAKATSDNQLPEVMQAWLNALEQQVPQSRVQFIKHPTLPTQGGFAFYTATAGQLFRVQVADYSELVGLDWDALTQATMRVDEVLYLVCTNAKRDWCCGRFGAAAFRALAPFIQQNLAPTHPEKVWMTTHLGGHRFAATLVVLPAGIAYGLVQPEEIPALVQAQRQGELMLNRYRGRNAYPRPVQAAEYFLYENTNTSQQDAFTLVQAQPISENGWQVVFQERTTNTIYTVQVEIQSSPDKVLVSCTPPKLEAELLFHVAGIS